MTTSSLPRPPLPVTAVLGAACVLAGVVPARAQSDSLRSVIGGLPDGQRVRLELRDAGERPVGRVRLGSTGDLVLHADAGRRRSLPLGAVRRLWSDEGSHAGRGALVGVAIGGATALVTGIALASDPSNETGLSPLQGGLLLGGVVGGPALLAGALIGSRFTDWRLRYSAEPGPGVAVQVRLP